MLRANSLGLIVVLAGLLAFGPVSTDLYLSSLPAIADAFGTPVSRGQLTLSAYLAGVGLSMLLAGALGDRFGRRPMLLAGIAGYVGVSIACVYADSIEMLIGLRFLQGICSCTAPVLARAVVRDLHRREDAARVLGYMSGIMGIVPVVVPIIGGYLLEWFGWTATFWFMAGYSTLAFVAIALLLQETLPARGRDALSPRLIVAAFGQVLRHRPALAYLVPFCFAYAGMFAFFTGFPVVLIRELGQPPELFGYFFAPVIAGFMLGALVAGRFGPRAGVERMFVAATVLSLVAGLALALFPWLGVVTAATLIVPMFGFILSVGLINPIGAAGVLGPFPQIAGKTSALLGALQMGAGAIGGYAVGSLGDGSAASMSRIVAVCGVLVWCSHAVLRERRARPYAG